MHRRRGGAKELPFALPTIGTRQCDQMLKLKHGPNVIKSGPNSISSCSYKKWSSSNYPKSHQSLFGYFCVSKNVAKNVQNWPNLVTLLPLPRLLASPQKRKRVSCSRLKRHSQKFAPTSGRGTAACRNQDWANKKIFLLLFLKMGGRPALEAVGGDLRSRGCDFKSQHRMYIFHINSLLKVKWYSWFEKDRNLMKKIVHV